jgi:hypothetical protein
MTLNIKKTEKTKKKKKKKQPQGYSSGEEGERK